MEISKHDWTELGGQRNPSLYREQRADGGWTYFQDTEHPAADVPELFRRTDDPNKRGRNHAAWIDGRRDGKYGNPVRARDDEAYMKGYKIGLEMYQREQRRERDYRLIVTSDGATVAILHELRHNVSLRIARYVQTELEQTIELRKGDEHIETIRGYQSE